MGDSCEVCDQYGWRTTTDVRYTMVLDDPQAMVAEVLGRVGDFRSPAQRLSARDAGFFLQRDTSGVVMRR